MSLILVLTLATLRPYKYGRVVLTSHYLLDQPRCHITPADSATTPSRVPAGSLLKNHQEVHHQEVAWRRARMCSMWGTEVDSFSGTTPPWVSSQEQPEVLRLRHLREKDRQSQAAPQHVHIHGEDGKKKIHHQRCGGCCGTGGIRTGGSVF